MLYVEISIISVTLHILLQRPSLFSYMQRGNFLSGTTLNSFSLSVSANSVNTGSLEGCGAPGLEKAPIDGGISQGALFVVTRPVSFILSSVPPPTVPG